MLTLAYLKHYLNYDPVTGIWTWVNIPSRSSVYIGKVAGRINNQGRRQIGIGGDVYYSGRLAWFYMTGAWPLNQIDHVNRVKKDDRWVNLREATQSENSFNRTWAEANGSMRGIHQHGQKFAVSIGDRYLGLFGTLEEATSIRDSALSAFAGPFAVHERETA